MCISEICLYDPNGILFFTTIWVWVLGLMHINITIEASTWVIEHAPPNSNERALLAREHKLYAKKWLHYSVALERV